jgi:hypothetical protein
MLRPAREMRLEFHRAAEFSGAGHIPVCLINSGTEFGRTAAGWGHSSRRGLYQFQHPAEMDDCIGALMKAVADTYRSA